MIFPRTVRWRGREEELVIYQFGPDLSGPPPGNSVMGHMQQPKGCCRAFQGQLSWEGGGPVAKAVGPLQSPPCVRVSAHTAAAVPVVAAAIAHFVLWPPAGLVCCVVLLLLLFFFHSQLHTRAFHSFCCFRPTKTSSWLFFFIVFASLCNKLVNYYANPFMCICWFVLSCNNQLFLFIVDFCSLLI